MPNPNLGNQFANARVPESLYAFGKPKESANNMPPTTYSAGATPRPSVPVTTFMEKSVEPPSEDVRMSRYKHMLEM